jgi:hypothetical protein
MKHLNIPLDDETYQHLKDAKGDRTWQQAICEEFGVDE